HQLGHAAFAVSGDVSSGLAAASRMTQVNGVAQVEVLNDSSGVRRVVIHVMTLADLAGAAMPAPIMGDDAVSLGDEEEHLVVPVVGAQRPAVVKHHRLCVLRP